MTQATGLCNTKDPSRLAYDPKTGVTQLAQAVNVDIDQTGRISRCTGYTKKRSEASHSGFSDSGQCLFVAGDTLYQLNQDYSRTALRTGLTLGARMSYAAAAGRIYYANSHQRGFIDHKGDNVWMYSPVERPDNNVAFSDPPNGHLVCFAFGRMLVVVGSVIFASEPSFYGAFNLAKYRAENDRITFLWKVPGGLFVGTTKQLSFYAGEQFEQVQRTVKLNVGVLEGSGAWADPSVLRLEADTRVPMFATPAGICVGLPGGGVLNVTKDNLALPSAVYASGAVAGNRYLCSIQP